jgi:hypothetical protein
VGVVGLTAAVCLTTVGVLLVAGRWIDRLPVGLTSRWHVPTSTVHSGLRYSIVRPVRCQSLQSVRREFRVNRLRQFASDNGFSRFTTEPTDQPVYLWLMPKRQTCLVAYNQFQQVG